MIFALPTNTKREICIYSIWKNTWTICYHGYILFYVETWFNSFIPLSLLDMIQFSQSQPLTNNVIQFTGNSSQEPDNLRVSFHSNLSQGQFPRELVSNQTIYISMVLVVMKSVSSINFHYHIYQVLKVFITAVDMYTRQLLLGFVSLVKTVKIKPLFDIYSILLVL